MFKVKNMMTKHVITAKREMSVYEALRILVDNDITGLPVVSDDEKLIGMVTEKDLLKLLRAKSLRGAKVADYMTSDVVSFQEDADLADVCECLINNAFRRVPILSGDKLVGIVGRRDVIKFILRVRREAEGHDPE